jgi:hypothetical protein
MEKQDSSYFEGKLMHSPPPVVIISYSCVFMKYWESLHGTTDAEDIRAGADNLLSHVAMAADLGTGGCLKSSSSDGQDGYWR